MCATWTRARIFRTDQVGEVFGRFVDEGRQRIFLQPLRRAEGGHATLRDTNYFQKLYYHKLGTPQAEDKLIYERPDNKELGFGGSVTDDGHYLIDPRLAGDVAEEPALLQGSDAAGCRRW